MKFKFGLKKYSMFISKMFTILLVFFFFFGLNKLNVDSNLKEDENI